MTVRLWLAKIMNVRISLLIRSMAIGIVATVMVINPLPAVAGSVYGSNQQRFVTMNKIVFDPAILSPREAASLQRGWAASAARLTAEAKLLAANQQRSWAASAARLTAEAKFYNANLQRGWAASAARLTAQAEFYTANLQRSWAASAARLTAQAEFYAGMSFQRASILHSLAKPPENVAAEQAAKLKRGWDAAAARLTAEAEFYLSK